MRETMDPVDDAFDDFQDFVEEIDNTSTPLSSGTDIHAGQSNPDEIGHTLTAGIKC